MSEIRKCYTCQEVKPVTDFYTKGAGRIDSDCKLCKRAKKRVDQGAVAEPDLEHVKGWLPFGTPMQREVAEALLSTGSIEAAAEAVGVTPRTLRAHLSELERAAAKRGWLPGDGPIENTPQGFSIKGTSTMYGPDGEVKLRWVKTKADEDAKYASLLQALGVIAEDFKGAHDPVAAPAYADDELLAVYPMGDPHVGMLSWARETGADFDLEIAEHNLVVAVDRLVAGAPPAREALILNLGDFFHTDNSSNQTARSHHALDVDSRWSKILGVGVRIMRRIIDRALTKHEKVTVRCEIGNHDDHSSVMLAICLAQYYERDPRVVIDTSPAKFFYFAFGSTLIATTHGDTLKPDKLPGVMAADQPKLWGDARHRFWYVGHVHHESVKEYPGVTVETFRTLAAGDAWHRGAGYRADRDMRVDIIHKRYGRISRNITGIDQIMETTP